MITRRSQRFRPFGEIEVPGESPLNARTRKFFSETVDFAKVVRRKSREADLKLRYRKVFETSLLVTLLLTIGLFQAARHFGFATEAPGDVQVNLEVADIPVTQQEKLPPPPPRPSVPIPTEDESVPDDLTIASTEIDLTELPPPPPPRDDDEPPIFVVYDDPPKIVGGIAALQKHLRYPKIAAAAGIEGVVFVNVLVNARGEAERFEVIKAQPANVGFEESAVEALKKVQWEAARQRDRTIRCWISIPVRFILVS